MLRSVGWTVAHVPFFDWYHKSESERRQLVAAKLAELSRPGAIEETVAVKGDPSAIAVADTEAKDDDHGPVTAGNVLPDEEDSDAMTSEPKLMPVTHVIADEFNASENELVGSEDAPCLEDSTSTATRAKRQRKGRRRKAKPSAPRAWRQTAVTFVLAAALGGYAVSMAYFLAATWRHNIPRAAVVGSMEQPRDGVGDPEIFDL